jgi:hypothetical protein
VLVIDYGRHEDASLREEQADVWMGFSEQELRGFAVQAGLVDVRVAPVAPALVRSGPDAHIGWLCLLGRRPLTPTRGSRKSSTARREQDSDKKIESESVDRKES